MPKFMSLVSPLRLYKSFWHDWFIVRFITRFIMPFIMPLLIFSCVAVEEPQGGPPDETPPKLVHSFPKDGATNFKGNKIRLIFDKDIAVDNPYSKVLIMPKLDKPAKKQSYSYKVNEKTLVIKLNVPLKANTTYSMHFNEAVKDTHEGTKAINTVLTFSTGSFIDSITAKGKIKELLTNKPVGEVSVYLYNAERDPKEWQEKQDTKEWQEKSGPDYYTTADKDGNFAINHIRLGKYYIRATTGKNDKHEIDYEKDKYGFLKDPIDLNDSKEDIVLGLIASDVRDFKYINNSAQQGLCEIIFNKAVEKYQLIALQTLDIKGKPQIYSLLSEKYPKVISVFNTFHLLEGESLKVKVIAEDALHMVLGKDLSISFKSGKSTATQAGLNLSLEPRPLPSVLPAFKESILFQKPIKEVKEQLLYFECKNQKKIALKKDELEWNSDRSKLTIKKNFSQEEIMEFTTKDQEKTDKSKAIQRIVMLQIEAGAFTAFNNKEKNKKLSISYPLRNEEETGTISGNVDTTASYFIIELLNSKDELVDAIRNEKSYRFTMIPPGAYKMRILLLNEGEDKWSPGNIRKNIEPNAVIFYDKEINIIDKRDEMVDFKFKI